MPPQKKPGQGVRIGKKIREAIPRKAKMPKRKLINPKRKK